MKKIITLLSAIFFFAMASHAQSDVYKNFKKKVERDGYKFEDDYILYLEEGEIKEKTITLAPHRSYKIFCMSDDPEVDDVDCWLYDELDNSLITKDTDDERMAIVNVSSGSGGKVKVKLKVVESSAYESSRCYIMITYAK